MDEKIIQNIFKKNGTNSIYQGVNIKGNLYTFTEQHYFDDRISIYLPENFIDLPDAIKKIKYPGEGRPQVIRTIPGGGVDFGINMLPLEGSDAMTEEFGQQMYHITKNLKPAELYIERKIEINELTGRKIDWFDYISHGVDTRIYNLIGSTYAGRKMVNYVFNCAAKEKDLWKPVAIEVLYSLSDVIKGE